MESSARKRSRIADDQRCILEKFFDEGMVGTGSKYKDKVDNAVMTNKIADESKGLSHSEKNKLAAEKWSHQNSDKKEKYQETAKIIVLENLGCQISSLIVDNMGVVFQIGSNQGNQLLSCNPEIGIKFREYFGSSNRKYHRNDVQDLFNKKYSEAVGKNCRVPYSKGGFSVIGLLEGIRFKKPYNYGAHQLRKIMESADDIKFIIDNNSGTDQQLAAPAVPSNEDTMSDDVRSLLTKISGSDAAERVLTDSHSTILEEVEVVDLILN
ncbi:uncharacterized protein LOC114538099 [Dendronephthya gigantea]|uniref:uncharacterized protein LOC114538099 n=1 Tax=Dendronephthya gigantea TaxID=151771 RepID=UPI00106BF476|nr:uncharacterized protein LOC114538099 [Dendronephthya gigantea]